MHALLDRTIPITASRLQSWALLLDHMTVSWKAGIPPVSAMSAKEDISRQMKLLASQAMMGDVEDCQQ